MNQIWTEYVLLLILVHIFCIPYVPRLGPTLCLAFAIDQSQHGCVGLTVSNNLNTGSPFMSTACSQETKIPVWNLLMRKFSSPVSQMYCTSRLSLRLELVEADAGPLLDLQRRAATEGLHHLPGALAPVAGGHRRHGEGKRHKVERECRRSPPPAALQPHVPGGNTAPSEGGEETRVCCPCSPRCVKCSQSLLQMLHLRSSAKTLR